MALVTERFPSGQREQTVNLPRKLRRFESFPLHQIAERCKAQCSCGHGTMVEPQPSKLMMRVRFPLPAPWFGSCSSGVEHTLGKGEVDGSIPSMSSIIKEGNDLMVIPFFVSAKRHLLLVDLPKVFVLANMPSFVRVVRSLFWLQVVVKLLH